MLYRSVRNQSPPVSFRDALLSGLAPDGGLYVPDSIPRLDPASIRPVQSLTELGARILQPFIPEVSREDLRSILAASFTFPIPLVQLRDDLSVLELFHGPTLAFKDVGARFMAEVLSHFFEREKRTVTILVATSGDTGSAVANGFYLVPNIEVFVLYPSGKVSPMQERQMTTLGGNIHAVEVDGSFDDCQRLVKSSFADRDIQRAKLLTTANSINVGRLLPQIVYYFWGYMQWAERGRKGPVVVTVPSGNFGNLTAALYARRMGCPISRFIAATNANDILPQFLRSGEFEPRPSVKTHSNAMDVGDPSNFVRLRALFHDIAEMKKEIEGISVGDDETLGVMKEVYGETGYILDPHSAVGVAASMRAKHRGEDIIVVGTAHPGKFPEVVSKALGFEPQIPDSLLKNLEKSSISTKISSSFEDWKRLIMT